MVVRELPPAGHDASLLRSMLSSSARRKLAPSRIRALRKGWATFLVSMSLLITLASIGQKVK